MYLLFVAPFFSFLWMLIYNIVPYFSDFKLDLSRFPFFYEKALLIGGEKYAIQNVELNIVRILSGILGITILLCVFFLVRKAGSATTLWVALIASLSMLILIWVGYITGHLRIG
jgi:hypothetical protein